MKRFFYLLLAAIFLVSAAGCSSLPKKFIRKKKEPAHVAKTIYTEEGPYQKQYSNDYYYKTHFTYWQTWHSELINELGGNSQRVARSAQESLSHLTEMKKYLKPERAAELDPQVQEMAGIAGRIESGYYSSSSSQAGLHSDLERIQRAVNNNFYFDKVKGDLISETVEL